MGCRRAVENCFQPITNLARFGFRGQKKVLYNNAVFLVLRFFSLFSKFFFCYFQAEVMNKYPKLEKLTQPRPGQFRRSPIALLNSIILRTRPKFYIVMGRPVHYVSFILFHTIPNVERPLEILHNPIDIHHILFDCFSSS